MWRIAIIAGCLILVAAPASAQDKATIAKLNDAWAAAFNRGDASAVAAMYTEDAFVLPPAQRWSRDVRRSRPSGDKQHSRWATRNSQPSDVLPLGPRAAREIGTVSLKSKSQPPQEITAKYAVVWREVGGKWKLATDIWNTSK